MTYGRVLREFGRNVEQARREYRRFVAAGVEPMPRRPWKAATRWLAVGGERFVEKIRGMLGYTSHGGVAIAVKRIESASPALRRRVQ